MNHQSYSPVVKHFAWLWWSPTASEALSYRLNLYRSMPPDLPRTLCIIRSRKKFGPLRAPHGRTNPCPAPLLQPLGPPLREQTHQTLQASSLVPRPRLKNRERGLVALPYIFCQPLPRKILRSQSDCRMKPRGT